jgi:hypothetical protein
MSTAIGPFSLKGLKARDYRRPAVPRNIPAGSPVAYTSNISASGPPAARIARQPDYLGSEEKSSRA